MRRIAWYTTIVLATISGLIILWQFRQVLFLFMLSLATAAAFRLPIDYFTNHRFPRSIALVLSYLIILGLTIGILVVISGPLIRDIEQATNQFAIGYERIQASWSESGVPYQRMLASQLPSNKELFGSMADGEGLRGLMGVTTGLISFLSSLGLIFILSLYWSADSIHFERLLLSLLPVGKRPTARMIWRGIEKGIDGMMDPVLVGLLLAWGTLVGVDLVSFPQAMLNRPLVAAAIAGALAGNLQAGLQVGVVLELFALDVLPIGASRGYPDYGPGAVVAGAMTALRPWTRPDGVGVAAAIGLALAAAGGLMMELVRRANGRRIRSAEAALSSGEGAVLERLQWQGLATDALRALLVTAAGLLLAGPAMAAVEALPGRVRSPSK